VIDWNRISAAIASSTGMPFCVQTKDALGGGCINQAYRVDGRDGQRYFIKLNSADKSPMFSAEAIALANIASTGTVRVPRPVARGIAGTQSFLALEYLELVSTGDARRLGAQIAAMHRVVGAHYGFPSDNFIGSTPQPNGWKDDWVTFWHGNRLGFQLRLAMQNGYGARLHSLGSKILDALPVFFEGYVANPSLLHGDLWGGNHAYLPDGTPVIFDPAAYYGDRECDLAMTELFGGYAGDFYSAYSSSYPLDDGYHKRRDLYNLYHVLNHANLFGGGYVRQAEHLMQRLLAVAG
jgi:protein-ribulosamine 3-kinase